MILAVSFVSVTLVAIVALEPETVNARSPWISTEPKGVSISFNKGQWSNATVVVNGEFTCDIGDLAPGEHVIAWNRFQGPTAVTLNQAMIQTISLRGEADGKQRVIDCQTSMGPGFVATSGGVDEDD